MDAQALTTLLSVVVVGLLYSLLRISVALEVCVARVARATLVIVKNLDSHTVQLHAAEHLLDLALVVIRGQVSHKDGAGSVRRVLLGLLLVLGLIAASATLIARERRLVGRSIVVIATTTTSWASSASELLVRGGLVALLLRPVPVVVVLVAATAPSRTIVLLAVRLVTGTVVLVSAASVATTTVTSEATTGATASTIEPASVASATSTASTASVVIIVPTSHVMVSLSFVAPARPRETVVFLKFGEFVAPLNFKSESFALTVVNVLEVVHESIVLVFIDVKQGAEGVLDGLDGADVISNAWGPPTVQVITALLSGQSLVIDRRLHNHGELLLLARQK